NLSRKKTIILIAHRLSTVKKCNQIYLLKHGRLLAQGTYSELQAKSQEFKNMTAVNE
ncbi:MAG: ABC transporter ATP-binding protein, partial [Candidatus Electrothrix sp. AX1]|nr:ABC transporter ATP-binding protein [Candidatus Electrothrix sp. AX1]